MEGDSLNVKCMMVMGGFELIIPRNWDVTVNVLPVFGGVSNKAVRDATAGPAKQLVIEGVAIMGGIDIKN
jgi:hypothetical protein